MIEKSTPIGIPMANVGSYAIIHDTVPYLTRLGGIGAVSPGLAAEVARLERMFTADFHDILPQGSNVTGIGIGAMSASIADRAMNKFHDHTIVSLDPSLSKFAHLSLDLTREVDPNTGTAALRPRFGAPSVDSQLLRLSIALASRGRNDGVVLAEVSCFTGRTITAITSLLSGNGIRVNAVLLGFASEDAMTVLRSSETGPRPEVDTIHTATHGAESRKMLGICGKNAPLNPLSGARRFIPFTEHPDWVGIPEEYHSEFASLSRRYNALIMGALKNHGFDSSKLGEPVELRRPPQERPRVKV